MITKREQELYDMIKRLHPDWDEEQIWAQVAIQIEAEKKNDEGNPITEEIFRVILRKAQEWLTENLPVIAAKVRDWFIRVIENLPMWFKNGIEYIAVLIRSIPEYF